MFVSGEANHQEFGLVARSAELCLMWDNFLLPSELLLARSQDSKNWPVLRAAVTWLLGPFEVSQLSGSLSFAGRGKPCEPPFSCLRMSLSWTSSINSRPKKTSGHAV